MWGVVSFVPASNLLLRIGTVVAERLLLVPSVAFAVLVACGASALLRQPRFGLRRTFWLLLVGSVAASVAIAFAVRVVTRNAEWQSNESLFVATLRVCPRNAKTHLSLGVRLLVRSAAVAHSRRAACRFCEWNKVGQQKPHRTLWMHSDIIPNIARRCTTWPLRSSRSALGSWIIIFFANSPPRLPYSLAGHLKQKRRCCARHGVSPTCFDHRHALDKTTNTDD
jgi:hypothetical protein